jgi:hypothetical protein
MRRSLTIIMVMGMIAAVLLAFAGSFFVGKVGGAEHVQALRQEILEVYGAAVASPESLSVKVRRTEKETGLEVVFPPVPRLARDERSCRSQMDRIAMFIYGKKRWRRTADFILMRLDLGHGKSVEKRYTP